MIDKTTNPVSAESPSPAVERDWREERRRQREERRASRGGGNAGALATGVILLGLGILFLLQNMGTVTLMHNWWALFILIPAVGAFAKAWSDYQNADGHLTAIARGEIISGSVLTLVSAAFLFNTDWGVVGPVLIIFAGLGILTNVLLSRES